MISPALHETIVENSETDWKWKSRYCSASDILILILLIIELIIKNVINLKYAIRKYYEIYLI